MRHLLPMVYVLIWTSVTGADICSDLPGYQSHGTSCFRVSSVIRTWAAAEASCVAEGGHLASIHSSEEQAFVVSIISGNTWIGLAGTPPIMAWVDNTALDYDNWSGSEPDDPWASCTRLYPHRNNAWQDIPCNKGNNYICRVDNVVPQRRSLFMKIPDGVTMDPAAVPSSSQTLWSALGCARRCHQDAQCVHFTMSEDGGKYLCETFTSLQKPPTDTPPTDIYQKIV